ncbi:hypothetical protein ACFL2X_03640 [Candidatus Latescibacterota bacterium]
MTQQRHVHSPRSIVRIDGNVTEIALDSGFQGIPIRNEKNGEVYELKLTRNDGLQLTK